jgi:hypothetical protein
MKENELIRGRIYRMQAGDFAEFSRISQTGHAIFHPPGEPDMQSSFAILPGKVDREATKEEAENVILESARFGEED